MNRTQNQIQARRGAMMVEAALVLPVLFLMVFGIIEYGWMFLKSHEISLATRDGARAGSLAGGTTADITSAINTRLTQAGIGSGLSTVTVVPAPELLNRGETFTVTISVDYGQSSGGLSVLNIPIIPVPDRLKSKFTMAKEGP
ncbi:MAG: TadE/TadG family type IV pilus assembly protein [Phycisphaerales bacterium]